MWDDVFSGGAHRLDITLDTRHHSMALPPLPLDALLGIEHYQTPRWYSGGVIAAANVSLLCMYILHFLVHSLICMQHSPNKALTIRTEGRLL